MDEIITEKNYPIQKLWIFKSIFRSLLSIILFFFVFYFMVFYSSIQAGKYSGIFIFIIIIIGFVIFNLIFLILQRASFHYSIEEKFLTLRQGIISKQQRYIPYGVIQNIFIKQDLFDRIFGLASLTIENASQGGGVLMTPQQNQQAELIGFYGNRVSIPGLTKEHAEILKGIILQKIKEHPIEDSLSGL
jgi:uncharacterized membrane protein YdbT with pleckstrin-like domain